MQRLSLPRPGGVRKCRIHALGEFLLNEPLHLLPSGREQPVYAEIQVRRVELKQLPEMFLKPFKSTHAILLKGTDYPPQSYASSTLVVNSLGLRRPELTPVGHYVFRNLFIRLADRTEIGVCSEKRIPCKLLMFTRFFVSSHVHFLTQKDGCGWRLNGIQRPSSLLMGLKRTWRGYNFFQFEATASPQQTLGRPFTSYVVLGQTKFWLTGIR